jgi:hypothetical protein
VPSPRQKKKENSQKKNRGEPKVKPDIVLDAILLRRSRSAGLFPRASPRFPKKKAKFKIEKEVARRTRTQKIMKLNKQELLQKKTVIGLTGRLQARSPADRTKKKTFCLKRRAGFAKTKFFFLSPWP